MPFNSRHIHAGMLYHQATLEQKSVTPDAAGGDAVTWLSEKTFWCHIRDVSGKLAMEAMAREEEIRTEIIARYDSAITTGKRIVANGKTYRIEAVLRRGTRNEWLHVIALEGVST